MTRPKVQVLCEGFLLKQGKAIIEAHSTCTLVQAKEHTIVVDTGDEQYRQRIIKALAQRGLDLGDVDTVVNTHLHFDHCSNNDLFPKARKVVHALEGNGEGFIRLQGDMFMLDEGVRVVHTPGHSLGAVSVFVEADKRTVIAGDAIPTYDNYKKWVPPGVVVDPGAALESMSRIVAWAEIVVPGHGEPFEVSR